MIDLQDRNNTPSMEDLDEYIHNPLFGTLCRTVQEKYQALAVPEFSRCSWEPGWNLKLKKSGRSLCVIYPREHYFTVLVVVGKQEKDTVEAMLPELSSVIREIYHETEEGMGQRWLMIDLEDDGAVYENVLRLIDVRYQYR